MRWITSFLAGALLVGGLGAVGTAPAAAAASITLDKQAPASVLLGDPIPYKLVASNPTGNDPLYNVGFSDVLPAGFEYVPNSTTPALAGNPQIDKVTGTLVWSNVTDLQPASTSLSSSRPGRSRCPRSSTRWTPTTPGSPASWTSEGSPNSRPTGCRSRPLD